MSVREATELTLTTPLIGAKACCAPSDFGSAGPSAPVIALAGVPNTGKSTLFNALTGAWVTMGNWPGTTVEVARGMWRTTRTEAACGCADCECDSADDRLDLTLIDLPGASPWIRNPRTKP